VTSRPNQKPPQKTEPTPLELAIERAAILARVVLLKPADTARAIAELPSDIDTKKHAS
jgi:hypothetical protein